MDAAERIIASCEETMANADYLARTPLSDIITNRLLLEILKELQRGPR
jgi:hypothetical protein